MPANLFFIEFTKLYERKQYRAQVQVITRTDKIIVVSVTAGEKELRLKKILFRKKNQWVKVSANFDMYDTRKPNQQLLEDIIKAVDEKL